MKITRISPLTGQATTLDLAVTQAQLDELARPGTQRRLVQEIFPALTKAEREFLKTGYTEADWLAMFPPELVEGLVFIGNGSVYATMAGDQGAPFLISTPIAMDESFSRKLDDWIEVDSDAEPHQEIMAAKAALGIRTTLGEIFKGDV